MSRERLEQLYLVVCSAIIGVLCTVLVLVVHNIVIRHKRPTILVEDAQAVEQAWAYEQQMLYDRPLPPLPADDPIDDMPPPATAQWVAVRAVTTAYSPHAQSCYPYDDGFTSTGVDTKVQPWGIAACPSMLPYGTPIIVPGYKPSRHYDDGQPWHVDDTGSAMRRAARRGVIHLDLRYIHQRSAMQYGRQTKIVFIDVSNMTEEQRMRIMAMRVGLE